MLEIKTFPNGKREIVATEGVVCRKGNTPSKDVHRMQMLPTDTIENFEEYTELPPYTKAQYDEKVAELIRERYSASEEFALQRKMINATNADVPFSDSETNKAIEEYDTYNTFVEECKIRAKNPDLYTNPTA